ncbi:MAG: SH3 domain-containing protein [Defluviitaleaceae bacterium]|nr:SH3 domain-containing protein [Defluviitaleaceae bacterium]
MSFFSFERAGEIYSDLFADWLHVHFLIRTLIILLVAWLVIFLLAQLVKYALAPGALMFFYHVVFRAWNFLFIESRQEWLYIRHHDEPSFSEKYLRLCDRVKQNRTILEHTRFKGMLHRSRKFSTWFMVTCGVAATLWVAAFGLHHEYAAPALAIMNEAEFFGGEIEHQDDIDDFEFPDSPDSNEEFFYTPVDVLPAPADWAPGTTFALNEQGRQGARLRGGPGIDGQTVLEILWDDARFTFLGESVPDAYVNGLYWLRVETANGTVGYLSSMLIESPI